MSQPNHMQDLTQARRWDALAQSMMNQQHGSGAYDGLNALLSAFIGAKAMKKSDQSWAEAYKAKFAQDNQKAEKKRQQDWADFTKKQDYLARHKDSRTTAEKNADALGLQGRKRSDYILGVTTPKGTVINNNGNPEPSPIQKELAKLNAQDFTQWRTDARNSSVALDKLTQLETLSQGMETGATPELLARAGQYFGSDAGVDYQTFNTLSKDLVLEQAQKLSGAMSDGDIALLEQSLPSFGSDPRANQAVFGLLKKYHKVAIDNFDNARGYLQNHGNLMDYDPLVLRKSAEPVDAQAGYLDVMAQYGIK